MWSCFLFLSFFSFFPQFFFIFSLSAVSFLVLLLFSFSSAFHFLNAGGGNIFFIPIFLLLFYPFTSSPLAVMIFPTFISSSILSFFPLAFSFIASSFPHQAVMMRLFFPFVISFVSLLSSFPLFFHSSFP